MVLCAQTKKIDYFDSQLPAAAPQTGTIMQISSKDNSRGASRSTKPSSNSANIFHLRSEFSGECPAGDFMSQVL